VSRKNRKSRTTWFGVSAGPRHRRDRDYGISLATKPQAVSAFGPRPNGGTRP